MVAKFNTEIFSVILMFAPLRQSPPENSTPFNASRVAECCYERRGGIRILPEAIQNSPDTFAKKRNAFNLDPDGWSDFNALRRKLRKISGNR
jgi:hypothetical protein